jgi:hypothetical protein
MNPWAWAFCFFVSVAWLYWRGLWWQDERAAQAIERVRRRREAIVDLYRGLITRQELAEILHRINYDLDEPLS